MPFKKGTSGNLDGYLPIGDALKMARKLTRVAFEECVTKYLYMTLDQIERSWQNKKDIPMVDLIVISIARKALVDSDHKSLEFLLDRSIGQSVRKVHVVTEFEDAPARDIPIPMTKEEELEMLDIYRQQITDKPIDVTPSES
jgi:hypothetical protein